MEARGAHVSLFVRHQRWEMAIGATAEAYYYRVSLFHYIIFLHDLYDLDQNLDLYILRKYTVVLI